MTGFYVSEYGARYYCGLDIVKEQPKLIYARIELPSPAKPKEPIIQEDTVDPKGATLNIAFGPIKDLRKTKELVR